MVTLIMVQHLACEIHYIKDGRSAPCVQALDAMAQVTICCTGITSHRSSSHHVHGGYLFTTVVYMVPHSPQNVSLDLQYTNHQSSLIEWYHQT